jgi:repressor LexA
MKGARILDGDIVFIREQPTVDNGEIACVIIEEEATLKRFYASGDTVTLVADNPEYPPMVYRAEEQKRIHILGKAVAFQSDIK